MTAEPAVVIPSNRRVPAEILSELTAAHVYIVEGEGLDWNLRLPADHPGKIAVLTLRQQRQDFGSDFDLLGHGSAACRNYGIWYAYHQGHDPIITLDDDCYPSPAFLPRFVDLLLHGAFVTDVVSNDGWVSTLHRTDGDPWYPRGFPYPERLGHRQETGATIHVTPAVHMGLWTGAADLNAVDKPAYGTAVRPSDALYATRDATIPLCAMNLGFRRDMAPFVYQIPWTSFDPTCALERYDDIIGGVITCALVRGEGGWVSFGPPFVDHRKIDLDLFKHAVSENLGNVLVGSLASMIGVSRGESDRFARARRMFRAADTLAAVTDLRFPMHYIADTYGRWLEYFA